jgi:organic hydroperoxide reductase OsmC/OhrA
LAEIIYHVDLRHWQTVAPALVLRKINNMVTKSEKTFPFEVKLHWIAGKKGLLSAHDAEGTLHVATPPAFGGEGKPWTPEHYFLCAVSGCFMTTFLAFAQKAGLSITGFECPVIGQIHLRDGRYVFTTIDLYPVVTLADESLREKATLVLEKTHKYCLVTNSISTPVFYHSQVKINPHSATPYTTI